MSFWLLHNERLRTWPGATSRRTKTATFAGDKHFPGHCLAHDADLARSERKWRRRRRQRQRPTGGKKEGWRGTKTERRSLITFRSMEAPLIQATKADTSLTPGPKQIHTPAAEFEGCRRSPAAEEKPSAELG